MPQKIKTLEKILVVEDNPNHLADAREFFSTIKGIDIKYAKTFSEARKIMVRYDALGLPTKIPKVDGVITDIYLPIGKGYVGRPNDEDPIGLLVAAMCYKAGIPFVFCTAGYHHGLKYNWINMVQREMGWPEMIDSSIERDAEADHKPWDRAYKTLQQLVEGQKLHKN